MGLLRGIIGLALAILFAAFAVANRGSVDITWNPLQPPFPVPLYLLALGLLAFGFLLGRFMAWLESLPVHFEKHKQKRRIKTLERELDKTRQKDQSVPQPNKINPDATDRVEY